MLERVMKHYDIIAVLNLMDKLLFNYQAIIVINVIINKWVNPKQVIEA